MDHPAHDWARDAQKLTDYWASHKVKQDRNSPSSPISFTRNGPAYRQEHKNLKGWKPESSRSHERAELIFTALAELSTRQNRETAWQWPAANKNAQSRAARSPTARVELESKPAARSFTGRELSAASKSKKTLKLEPPAAGNGFGEGLMFVASSSENPI